MFKTTIRYVKIIKPQTFQQRKAQYDLTNLFVQNLPVLKNR
jgi:hypothetical protein